MAALQLDEQEALRPYLPRLLIQWLSDTPASSHKEIEGSVAFVDISGFTKLSERLARSGRVGAEELTEAIGSCFSRLLGVAYGNGGGLIKFGGDALLLLFRGAGHEAKASRAALGMRRALREIGALDCSGRKVLLRMSVGIHSGRFNMFLVGDSHRELLITGPSASQTVLMENTAQAGEILVSRQTAAALPPGVLGKRKGPGILLRREPPGLSAELLESDPRIPRTGLLGCIPLAVQEHLLAGIEQPEHKRVTVAFVRYSGTDELIERQGPAVAARVLGSLISDIQRAADKHGVCFLGTDIDRDGGKVILSAGAPTAHENDEERMLLAIREVADSKPKLPIRIGVNRGHVFAGDIGPAYRRTYTVMGDSVNLAARLMAKSEPGRILATRGVLAASRTEFETEALPPFPVKGKTQPILAFTVGRVVGTKRTSDHSATALVGRESEVALLADALESARTRRGRMVELVGEPGIGKSRLIDALRQQASEAVVLSTACELYEASSAYFPFRALLRRVMGIGEQETPEIAGTLLQQLLELRAPRLAKWAPLLAIPIDAVVPPTADVEQLDHEFRRARLEQALIDLLRILLDRTVVVTIEDAHWMDEASADLLRCIAKEIHRAPWLFCVSRRDVETGFAAPQVSSTTTLRLQPLDGEAAVALLHAASEEAPLAGHEIAALVERSGGNPLFLTELLAAARATGGIESLPDSVEALISARIDRMPPRDRMTLRYLSVLGPTFSRELVSAVLKPEEEDGMDHLDEFIVAEGEVLHFRHALIRDSAYEGLPFQLRRGLHARIGEKLEHGSAGEAAAEVLSLHFFHAHRYQPALRYSRIAGDRAREKYANVQAAEFYERALESARRLGSVEPVQIAELFEALGEVRQILGEFGSAAEAFRRARRTSRGDALANARLLMKEGIIARLAGRYERAIRTLHRARRMTMSSAGAPAAALQAQIAVAYAGIYRQIGRPSRVIDWCKAAIRAAEDAGDKDALAHAYFLLDLAFVEKGDWGDATYSADALSIYEELGDLGGQGVVLNNLGVKAYWHGRWDEALEYYERGREAREKIGDAVNAALGTLNIGEILIDQGRLGEAEPLIRHALRVWKAAGYRSGIGHALRYLGRVASRLGHYEQAAALFAEAREEAQRVGGDMDVIETDTRIVENLVLQGRSAEAEIAASDALARAMSADAVDAHVVVLHRLRGWARMKQGNVHGAQSDFHESLRVAQTRNSEFELALTLRALACLSETEKTERAAVRAAEFHSTSKTILDRLGVVMVFEPCS